MTRDEDQHTLDEISRPTTEALTAPEQSPRSRNVAQIATAAAARGTAGWRAGPCLPITSAVGVGGRSPAPASKETAPVMFLARTQVRHQISDAPPP